MKTHYVLIDYETVQVKAGKSGDEGGKSRDEGGGMRDEGDKLHPKYLITLPKDLGDAY